MSSISLSQDESYRLLTMHHEGKFNRNSLDAFNQALDQVEIDADAKALIITGEEKSFAQGLDLQYLSSVEGDVAMRFVEQCMDMVGRLLRFPIPIVAAINGHAFGLGAMIVLASDYKLMRHDRGYFCLPEVDLNMVLIPSMNALVTGKLSGAALRDTLLAGGRIAATQAQQLGIIDEECALEDLLATAKTIAMPMMGKDRNTMTGLKQGINKSILAAIAEQ